MLMETSALTLCQAVAFPFYEVFMDVHTIYPQFHQRYNALKTSETFKHIPLSSAAYAWNQSINQSMNTNIHVFI